MEAIPKTAPICPIFNRFRLWIKQKFRNDWYIFVVCADRRAIDLVSIKFVTMDKTWIHHFTSEINKKFTRVKRKQIQFHMQARSSSLLLEII